jgi:hypothetical protein
VKQNWTKRPDIWVVVAETKCCGLLSHDPKSPAVPVHWDMKKMKWVRCKVKAYWKLTPTARVNREGKA